MPADNRTQAKLDAFYVSRFKGDIITGIWVCPATAWYQRGETYIKIQKGDRLTASWKFQGILHDDENQWRLTRLDISAIAPPKNTRPELTWPQRLWRFFWPPARTV